MKYNQRTLEHFKIDPVLKIDANFHSRVNLWAFFKEIKEKSAWRMRSKNYEKRSFVYPKKFMKVVFGEGINFFFLKFGEERVEVLIIRIMLSFLFYYCIKFILCKDHFSKSKNKNIYVSRINVIFSSFLCCYNPRPLPP